ALRSSAPYCPKPLSRVQKQSSPPKKNGGFFLSLPLVRGQKSDHPTEMIVVAVAQHERIEIRGIYLENGHIVDDRFRRVTKIDQNVAHLVAALRFRMHRESPLAVQAVRGGASGVRLAPVRRSMVRPSRFSEGMNCMT